jgi:hypothetical protein
MSKNPEGQAKQERSDFDGETRQPLRDFFVRPSASGGRFLRVGPDPVNTFFQKIVSEKLGEFPKGY